MPRPDPPPPGCTGKEDEDIAGMTKALLGLPGQETGKVDYAQGVGWAEMIWEGRTQGQSLTSGSLTESEWIRPQSC